MLPMYQRIGNAAYKKDLTNTVQILNHLHNPHNEFKSIHIAGTNGKGTSAHAIAAIMQEAGYSVGLYTSPHLKSFTERIRIDGHEMEEAYVVDFVQKLKPRIEQINPSFFEVTVAMAFSYFAYRKVDIAIIETGLGGRLDSTNVLTPEVCLITNIGFDHMNMLGGTLEKIAYEKAGIIKENIPVVVGTYQKETYPIFERAAKDKNAKLLLASERLAFNRLPKYFPGYFKKNVPGIEKIIEEIRKKGYAISPKHFEKGLRNVNDLTGLKGRFQILNEHPLTIADVSHNADGIEALFSQVLRINKGKLHVVFGSVNDKDLSTIVPLLPKTATYYWTQSSVPRSLSANELAYTMQSYGIVGRAFAEVNRAVRHIKSVVNKNDTILVTGSTFVVAEVDGL